MYTEQASEVIIRQFDQANTVQSALLEIEAGLLLTFLQPVQGVFPLFRRQMADVMDAPREAPFAIHDLHDFTAPIEPQPQAGELLLHPLPRPLERLGLDRTVIIPACSHAIHPIGVAKASEWCNIPCCRLLAMKTASTACACCSRSRWDCGRAKSTSDSVNQCQDGQFIDTRPSSNSRISRCVNQAASCSRSRLSTRNSRRSPTFNTTISIRCVPPGRHGDAAPQSGDPAPSHPPPPSCPGS